MSRWNASGESTLYCRSPRAGPSPGRARKARRESCCRRKGPRRSGSVALAAPAVCDRKPRRGFRLDVELTSPPPDAACGLSGGLDGLDMVHRPDIICPPPGGRPICAPPRPSALGRPAAGLPSALSTRREPSPLASVEARRQPLEPRVAETVVFEGALDAACGRSASRPPFEHMDVHPADPLPRPGDFRFSFQFL